MIAGYFQLICTQKVEKFTTPVAGSYRMECWGAQGGGNSSVPGGKGSYTKGTITIEANKLYSCWSKWHK